MYIIIMHINHKYGVKKMKNKLILVIMASVTLTACNSGSSVSSVSSSNNQPITAGGTTLSEPTLTIPKIPNEAQSLILSTSTEVKPQLINEIQTSIITTPSTQILSTNTVNNNASANNVSTNIVHNQNNNTQGNNSILDKKAYLRNILEQIQKDKNNGVNIDVNHVCGFKAIYNFIADTRSISYDKSEQAIKIIKWLSELNDEQITDIEAFTQKFSSYEHFTIESIVYNKSQHKNTLLADFAMTPDLMKDYLKTQEAIDTTLKYNIENFDANTLASHKGKIVGISGRITTYQYIPNDQLHNNLKHWIYINKNDEVMDGSKTYTYNTYIENIFIQFFSLKHISYTIED